ncbi:hypothetical protein [Streptomyces wuyuanensis]
MAVRSDDPAHLGEPRDALDLAVNEHAVDACRHLRPYDRPSLPA